jgi:hypothetical protein
MRITPPTANDETGIKALLHACELPSDDISAMHLVHFFIIKDAGNIAISGDKRTPARERAGYPIGPLYRGICNFPAG